MEWVTIDYNGTEIQAADFLNGVLVYIEESIVFIPGWHVLDRGDMDGPQLRRREKEQKGEYEIVVKEK